MLPVIWHTVLRDVTSQMCALVVIEVRTVLILVLDAIRIENVL